MDSAKLFSSPEPTISEALSKTGNLGNSLQVSNSLKRCGTYKLPTRKEYSNDFGEDVTECLIRRRDSSGAQLCINPSLTRSRSSPYDRPARRTRVRGLLNAPPAAHERLHTYYPLHQGPSITITSADGTALYAETESDSQRNAAAQCLFRALVRQRSVDRLLILDGHMEKIIGSVEEDLEIQDTNARKGDVSVWDCEWEVQSMQAVVERTGREKGKRKGWKRVFLGSKAWNRCVARVFG